MGAQVSSSSLLPLSFFELILFLGPFVWLFRITLSDKHEESCRGRSDLSLPGFFSFEGRFPSTLEEYGVVALHRCFGSTYLSQGCPRLRFRSLILPSRPFSLELSVIKF